MKSFSFNQEMVLKLRKFHENEARIELGRATGILSEIENKLYVLGQERIRAQAAQFNPANSAGEIQQYMFYLIRLDNTREQLLKEAEIAEKKVEETREAYLEASRERKIMDKLKEKRQLEHRKLMLANESKELDEISASAWIRLEKTA